LASTTAGIPQLPGRLAAAAAGAVLPLSFAPFGWYVLAPFSLALLFRCWDCPPREAAWRGFWFGIAAFIAGTWWLYISVRLVGGTPLPVALLLLGGLVAIMAAWIAVAGFVAARLRTGSRIVDAGLLAPAAWVLVEWLRGWVLSGFPWLSIGYGQIDGPFAAWAPVGGVYAVSLVCALLAGALVTLVAGTARDRALAVAAALVLALATWGLVDRAWTAPDGKPLRVGLVQGAIPQLLKWEPGEQQATLELYASLTLALREHDLVIWPEAAIPVPDDLVPQYLEDLAALAASRGWQLLVGILTHEPDRDEYRNSLLALGPERGVYHKRHLVPFGEFFPVPDFVRSWMRLMSLPYSDISHGDEQQAPLRAHGVGLAPTICYEDAFGAEQLVFLPEAGMLVNVSNDAWFGDTIAPHQHLQMARMRSLETGRYLVRSTNTGITAIIDERGGLRATVPQFEAGVLTGMAQPFSGATPYVRTGNWPVLLLAATAILMGAVRRWRRPPR
jgi:apolipoprotein N-acyltransferase